MGPSSGSWVHKIPVVGSDQFRQVAGIPNKGGQRSSVWVSRNQRVQVGVPSSRSRGQSLSPLLAQTSLGSFQPNEACFSGPRIYEMGEPSLMTSPTPLAHSVKPKIFPLDKVLANRLKVVLDKLISEF